LGLEHLSSSLNGVGERALAKGDDREPWAVYLLPHEFVHAWCGKYRRPAGMFTRDFHTPKHTEMLWIYEGLTQWLGELLAVRAGLFDEDEWRGRLALKISWLNAVTGRGWRPLADTAIASYHLRGGSPNWIALRRGQDYYNEGLLIWLEADTIIRDATDGQRSLDDFCRRFFGAESGADVPDSDDKVVPYELDEVIGILSDIADHDWRGFFEARVMTAQNAMPLDFVSRAGHRLQYANEPSDYLARAEKDREYIHGLDSLGASFGESGNIFDVVPGTPADLTGLAPGMTIQGVNGKKFSLDRMRDAIADSVTRRSIELLLLEGDRFETVNIEYAGGPRYLELVRDESRRDLLSEILKPRVEKDDDGEEEND
jgi:predicted metalloprotease with PDZ domain